MIQNFVFILNNGIKTGVDEFLPDIPLFQQINDPEFHPKAYEWESSGQRFTRMALRYCKPSTWITASMCVCETLPRLRNSGA